MLIVPLSAARRIHNGQTCPEGIRSIFVQVGKGRQLIFLPTTVDFLISCLGFGPWNEIREFLVQLDLVVEPKIQDEYSQAAFDCLIENMEDEFQMDELQDFAAAIGLQVSSGMDLEYLLWRNEDIRGWMMGKIDLCYPDPDKA